MSYKCSAINFLLLFSLGTSYSHNRIQDRFELDDAAREKLEQVAEEFNNGNEEKAKELLANSELDPKLKELFKSGIDVEEANQELNEAGEKIENNENENEDKNEDGIEIKDETEDEEPGRDEENAKQDLPLMDSGNIKGVNGKKEVINPNVARQITLDDLNNEDSKRSFSTILGNVKSTTADLEKAVEEGKVDVEKAMQMSDLQNVISAFQTSSDL